MQIWEVLVPCENLLDSISPDFTPDGLKVPRPESPSGGQAPTVGGGGQGAATWLKKGAGIRCQEKQGTPFRILGGEDLGESSFGCVMKEFPVEFGFTKGKDMSEDVC